MVLTLAVLVVVSLSMALELWKWYLERSIQAHQLPVLAPANFAIEIIDWGPEFTGTMGTLDRWRWVVYMDEELFLLGNAPTSDRAIAAAILTTSTKVGSDPLTLHLNIGQEEFRP